MNQMEKTRMQFINDGQKQLLSVAEPLVGGTSSWLSLDDVGDPDKASVFYFETAERMELYMTTVSKEDKSFAKLYIVGKKYIAALYVDATAVYPVCKYLATTPRPN